MRSNKTFLQTKFYLRIAALAHIAQAVLICLGKQYYSEMGKARIYEGIPGMRYADWGLALVLGITAVLQMIVSFGINRENRKQPKTWLPYVLLVAGQVVYALLRRILTGMTPFTNSVVLQVLVYALILLMSINYEHGQKVSWREYERRQDSVRGDSLLQGAGSVTGNSETPEAENEGTDQSEEDRGELPDHAGE